MKTIIPELVFFTIVVIVLMAMVFGVNGGEPDYRARARAALALSRSIKTKTTCNCTNPFDCACTADGCKCQVCDDYWKYLAEAKAAASRGQSIVVYVGYENDPLPPITPPGYQPIFVRSFPGVRGRGKVFGNYDGQGWFDRMGLAPVQYQVQPVFQQFQPFAFGGNCGPGG